MNDRVEGNERRGSRNASEGARALGWRGGFAALAILVGSVAAAAGCTIHDPLRVEDSGVVLPVFRAVWRFEDARGEPNRSADPERSAEPSGADPGGTSDESGPLFDPYIGGFELDLSGAYGSDEQDLPAGTSIRIRGETFEGPSSLDFDFRLTRASLAYRGGARYGWLSLEGIAGIAAADVRLDVQSEGKRDRQDGQTYGPYVGMHFGVAPGRHRDLEVFGRITALAGLLGDEASLTAWETGATLRIWRELALFAGWRWWNYRRVQGSKRNDLEIDLSGPAAGLELRF